ncbi:TPA: hypothetical protein DEB00_01590 [Candidatus Uhrbacteria bacterium]|nr:hypothetical protein [Candidatus Uhrbacteria bacterium]
MNPFRSPKSGPVSSGHSEKQKQFFRSLKKGSRFPSFAQLTHLPKLISKRERPIFWTAAVVALLSFVFIFVWGYTTHLVIVPAHGGTYTEGLIGSPQFINPIYASANDVDADISRLVYSGLMKWDPQAGLIPDLAESYTVSDDELVYTLSLRSDAMWHDGTPVTPRDIIFTFHTIQNPDYGSPLNGTFRGVSIEQVDERTVSFTLDESFAPFLSTLGVGILPADYWGELDPGTMRLAERNLVPIGSGPYKFDTLEKDTLGVIKSYKLQRNTSYYAGTPFINTFIFKFYPDTVSAIEALNSRRVEGIAFAPKDQLSKLNGQIVTPSLPQITALFFNLKKDIVSDKNMRVALGSAINKDILVQEILQNQAAVTNSPVLSSYHNDSTVYGNPTPFDQSVARANLDTAGWTVKEGDTIRTNKSDESLILTITTVDQPETVSVAERIAAMWREVEIDARIEIKSPTEFRDVTLKNRDYSLLLSGILMGSDPDPYPFWHSSQITAPGLNLSQFANRDADGYIETARSTTNIEERRTAYASFADQINSVVPAIFLYQPTYTYVTANKIHGIELETIVVPSDRFGRVQAWYIKTKKRLSFLAS